MLAVLVLLLALIAGTSSCVVIGMWADEVYNSKFAPAPKPLPTIDGPERRELLDGIEGTVLHQVAGRLDAVSIPSLAKRTLPTKPPVWFASGPDSRGRYVYATENERRGPKHELRVASSRDGSERVLFERRGLVNWHSTLHLVELAPTTGRLALSSQAYDEGNPFSPSTPMELEVWNLDDGEHRVLASGLIWTASWFPDGRRLAIERWLAPEEFASHDPQPYPIARRLMPYDHPNDRPGIEIIDTDSGEKTWACWGACPLVAPDGKRMMVELDEAQWEIVDLASRTRRSFALPGALGYPLAWMADDVVLYPARATTGSDPGYLRTSTKRPQPNWTLKAGRLDSKEFVTIVPSVGRWEEFGFGRALEEP